jgi:hypothetical protein
VKVPRSSLSEQAPRSSGNSRQSPQSTFFISTPLLADGWRPGSRCSEVDETSEGVLAAPAGGFATRVGLLLVSEFEVLSHRKCRRI